MHLLCGEVLTYAQKGVVYTSLDSKIEIDLLFVAKLFVINLRTVALLFPIFSLRVPLEII